MRLNKFIANATGTSRRQADDAIADGRVRVNGKTAILGERIEESDKIELDGTTLTQSEFQYVLVNKPVGYVCSKKSQDERPTIYSLLPDNLQHLKTAGRLDTDSHGLVLLTNDGDFAHQMTHPSFKKEKRYIVQTDKPISKADLDRLNKGVSLEDGVSHLQVSTIDDNYKVVMQEGKNRQIRRTFEALGYTVTDLERTQFGGYNLDQTGATVYAVVDKIK